jgi:transposase InsO family protein
MPWKERRAMGLKIEFVERVEAGETVAALCREYGISRTAGHKWIKRFEERGHAGLEEESRRPKSAPLATAEELVIATIEAREAHPRWGPRKLHTLLRRRFGENTPSVRTIARILKRANKVRERRKRAPISVIEQAPKLVAEAPNDVWTVDFKGWWRVLDGSRCEPLTVRDACSRFVLALVASSTTAASVRAIFEPLFRRHGVPKTIQCDNGTPFISVKSRAGLSSLSAWWTTLGIRVVRSRPGCPQDNGGHERMHGDVCAEVQTDPAETLVEQQRLLDRWRQEFNHVRPHDALGGKTPAEVYKVVERRRPVPRHYEYPKRFYVHSLDVSGGFTFRGDYCRVGAAFARLEVGIEIVDAMRIRAWLHDVDLGLIETLPSVDAACFESSITSRRKRASKKFVPNSAGGSAPPAASESPF